MNVALVVAAVALVPQPKSLNVTGGEVSVTTSVSCVTDASVPKEGYRLKVAPGGIEIASSDGAGRLYARVTLDQLLNAEKTAYACCEIDDAPRYPWRAWLLDCCRHFQTKETVLDVLDVMVLHKMNVLHWHITEDQAWRIPSAKYPKLIAYGAARPYNPGRLNDRWHKVKAWVGDDGRQQAYGPYSYTRRDIDDVLAYAKARHIKVVPEIDFPGHMRAALAAYPEFGCRLDVLATNRVPRATWGVEDEVLCVGNDATVAFVMDILDEVCEMFPDSDIIHIGGDECPVKRWAACPKCQARMKAEGLKTERELQTWLVRKVAAHLAAKGRRTMGWAEIVEKPGLDPKSVVPMAWLYPDPGLKKLGMFCPTFAELTDMGYDVIAGSHKHEYWGTPHARTGDEYDPQPQTGYYFQISLEDTYDLDLSCGEPKPGKGRILGTEAFTWGEGVWNFFDVMYRSLPRTCAVAELAWGAPEPRNYVDFYERMLVHAKRLRAMKIPCAPIDRPGSKRATPAGQEQGK